VYAWLTSCLADNSVIVASTMDEIQTNIFGMGFGPMPFYQRCSVAVQHDEEEEELNGCEIIITKTVPITCHLQIVSKLRVPI
jgi:hypothetical protein